MMLNVNEYLVLDYKLHLDLNKSRTYVIGLPELLILMFKVTYITIL